jgi:uncharacterized protein YbaP (TraB family)
MSYLYFAILCVLSIWSDFSIKTKGNHYIRRETFFNTSRCYKSQDLFNMRFFVIVSLSFLCYLPLSGQKKYPALMWKIEGNGLAKPSYLYGTMHVSSKIAFNLSDAFFEALTNADAIALETNPEFWLSYYRDSGLVEVAEYFMDTERFFGDYGIYDRIIATNESNLNQMQRLFQSQEPMLNQLLYRFNYGQENYEETTYLDMFIFQTGKKRGKPIYSLEDFIEAQLLVERSGIPDEDDEDEDFNFFGGNYGSQMDLETAYLERDLDLIDSLITKNFSKNYRKYLLTIRNKNMVDALDSLMPHQSIFAGVGAAHLPGEDGMIQLLRDRGYTVTPSEFKRSGKAKKTFNKLKSAAVDMPVSKITSDDGRITLEAPGRFYKDESFFSMSADEVSFLPDYANGAYFNYERLKKRFYDKDALKVKSLHYIDSVLYLITPGNIQSSKKIKVGNYDAIDVTTELPRGNFLRMVCVDTPQELIVFKAGGNKSFIKSKNVNRYFKNIVIRPGSNKELLKKANVKLGLPENSTITVNDNFTFDIIGINKGKFYAASSNHLRDFSELEQDLFEVNYIVDEFAEIREFEIMHKDTISPTNLVAKIKTPEDDELFINIQIFHNNYYLLTTNDSETKAKAFFDSFGQQKVEENLELLTEVKDTIGGYSVISYDRKKVSHDLMEAYRSLVNDFEQAHKRKDSLNYDYSGERFTRTFRNPNSGESVRVSVERKNSYLNMRDIIKDLKEDLAFDDEPEGFREYQFQLLTEDVEEDRYQAEFIQMKDGTSRVIKNKIVVKGNRVLTVSAVYDTLLGKTVFVDTFFSTFQPFLLVRDTIDFSKPRCIEWIHDAQSESYQLSEQAKKSLNLVSMDTLCKSDFEQFLLNDTLEVVKENASALLFKVDNNWTDEERLLLFHSYYKQNKLNVNRHKEALKAIGRIKTKESTALFMELIVENPPVIKNDYEFFRLFKVFDDSMELIKPHLKEFQEFGMEYDEFLPTVIYYIDRGIFEKVITTKDITPKFEKYLTQRMNRNLRKMAYNESGRSNDYTKLRDEMLESFSILHSYPDAENKFGELIAKSDTITDKKYRAHLLAKRINRGNAYRAHEIDTVMADTNYVFSFFQWLDDDSLKHEIFTTHKIDTNLFYLAYLKQNSGYRASEDEYEFLGKEHVETFGESGIAYIYSVKSSFGSLRLQAVYFIDENKFPKLTGIKTKSLNYSKDDNVDEKIEELLKRIRFDNRPRVTEQNFIGGFSGLF